MTEKLKVGVVGLGIWGQNHPLVYDDYHRSEVAVVCDMNEERAREVASRIGCDWTTSVDELASSDITTFSVATPDHAHFGPVSTLLEANKNVLVEKPLTTSLDEAKELVRLAEASSGLSMVDFHLRWDPQWSMVKDTVASGEMGKPHMGYIRLSDAIEVAEKWLSWAGRSGPHWFLFPHLFDLMTWIIDEVPETIYATGHKGILQQKGVDTFDAMQAMVSFPSGANVTFETSWVVPNSNPSVTDCHMVLYSETGKIEYDQDFSGISFATPEKYSYPWVPLGKRDRWGQLNHYMYSPMKYFVDCVLDGKTPECTFREGMVNTAMIEACLRSIETGQPVKLADLLG
ncbi:Gfo/Idh/MocA family oxidoreductase [Leucobacter sp. CSA1]|uniref:Gfo/Idh/MocA family oxidoreductase n=1 Tax=Leucobacter chromiisoli TaxID=2796471 RepID=A0A934UUY1_9MICO|nr:Gfo/Idh/MocA family oxidoreductase [Leucobacter chromiisoli]MBK0418653.1 Gfo/Idh/MocA family oxidoreductase [Leucobacter chromiisoli]